MFMVILNHIADVHFNKTLTNPNIIVYLFEGISHCAVPVFLMLTGAFLIDKVESTDMKSFYVKSFKKLGIPTACFAILYWSYDYCRGAIDISTIVVTLKNGFAGVYAHWYMVMLSGIYMLLPMVSIIKSNISKDDWNKAAWLFFIWCIISRWTDVSAVSWSIGNVFFFLGYVFIGDILKNRDWKKNNYKGIICFIFGNLLLCMNYYILYKHVYAGGDYYNKLLNLYGAPLVAMASVIIFSAFSMMCFKWDMSYLASKSFTIYLSHKMIIDIFSKIVFGKIERVMNYNLKFHIPLETVITFILTLGVVLIIDKIIKLVFPKQSWLLN